MTVLTTMVSHYLNEQLEIVAYVFPENSTINVKLKNNNLSIRLSWIPTLALKKDLLLGQFIVVPIKLDRALLKEVKATEIFTDTGKRVQIEKNLWGDIWQLTPEQLSMIEKETPE